MAGRNGTGGRLSQAIPPSALESGGHQSQLQASALARPAQAFRTPTEAELASRSYQQQALALPGALGFQAMALAGFYCGLARQQVGADR